jgi:hypothetical protein
MNPTGVGFLDRHYPERRMELNGTKLEDATVLSTLAERDQGGGPEPDLTLSLVWNTGGGR